MKHPERNSVFEIAENISPNNRMHADSKKRRSFRVLLFAAGDAKRLAYRHAPTILLSCNICRLCSSFILKKFVTMVR